MKKRSVALLILLALSVAGWRLFLSLGHILHYEDVLERADVIYVLGGTRIERAAEGGELYNEGWAPRILLSPQLMESAEEQLRARGVTIPQETDVQANVLTQMGVPADAISMLNSGQATTATEADELVRLASTNGWQRLIIVTSKMHTARVKLTFERRFASTGTQIIVRASRYDRSDVARWWTDRASLRFALFEAQKLAAYWVGIAD